MSPLIITCEHGGNEVPAEYNHLFNDSEVLTTHRGWDPGSLNIAKFISENLGAPLHVNTITRLLIELNRSTDSAELFSEFSRVASEPEKRLLLQNIYRPYRDGVEEYIAQNSEPTIHFSIHTFTPVLNSVERTVDVGILFDPSRNFESRVAKQLSELLRHQLPNLRIEFNMPYAGIDDGFTTYLRTRFPDDHYAGIELEISQKFVGQEYIQTIQDGILQSLRSLIA